MYLFRNGGRPLVVRFFFLIRFLGNLKALLLYQSDGGEGGAFLYYTVTILVLLFLRVS
jgi:hypothetical protein